MNEKIIGDVTEDIKNSSFLRTLKATAEASCEEDLAPLFELLDPLPSAVDMGSKFKETIGYNPITYYSEDAASRVFADVCTLIQEADPENPHTKTLTALNAQQDEIINEMLSKTEATRDQRAYFGVKNRIRWILKDSGEMDSATVNSVMDQLEARYNMNYRPRNSEPAVTSSGNAQTDTHQFNQNTNHMQDSNNRKGDYVSLPSSGKHPMKATNIGDFDITESELEIEESELDSSDDFADDLLSNEADEASSTFYEDSGDDDDDYTADYDYDDDEYDDDEYDGLPHIRF